MKTTRCVAMGLLVAALGGCTETNPVRDAAQGVGLASRPSEPAGFVRESRANAPSGFLPVGVSAPARTMPRRTPEEFRAMEAQLEQDRRRLESQGSAARQAGSTPPARPPQVPR